MGWAVFIAGVALGLVIGAVVLAKVLEGTRPRF